MKSWKDITIGQYINLLPSATKGKGDFETIYHKLNVLFGNTIDEARDLTMDEIESKLKGLDFMSHPPSGKPVKRFKLKGQWYEVKANIKDHKAENYMFVMDRLKELNRDPETTEKNLHLIMATVCHPIKRKGFKWVSVNNDLAETAQTFYNFMPISVAYPISVFFCELSKVSIPTIKNYLNTTIDKVEKETTQIKKDLQNNSAGS